MSEPAGAAAEACAVCGRRASHGQALGESAFFLCSHLACPHRHPVTAAPATRPLDPFKEQ